MGGIGDPEYDAMQPAIAYNSTNNEYLVVWAGDDLTDGGLVDDEYEIFGQRLDASTGLEIGANDFRISDMGGTGNPAFGGQLPAVAYNSTNNEYLVVWFADEMDPTGGGDDEVEIYAQRLAATGTEVGENDFRISDMGGTGNLDYGAEFPKVAYNSTNNEYLVVWLGDDNVGGLVNHEIEVFGQRLDAATGAEIGANDFRISDMGGTGDPNYDAYPPAVSYNAINNQYLVAWAGDDNVGGLVDEEREVFGQLLDAATGAEVGANDFRISDLGGTGSPQFQARTRPPAVVYNITDNQYLVAWAGDEMDVAGGGDDEYEIFGQLLDAVTGAEVGANDFRISDLGPDGDAMYGADFVGGATYDSAAHEYLVVWWGDDDLGGLVDEEWEAFGQRLDAVTGAEVGENDFRISEMGGTGDPEYDARWPAAAYAGASNQLLVIWWADDNTGGLVDEENEIFGQQLRLPAVFADGFESGDTDAWSLTVP
jgi:hypothetical protein